MPANTPIFGFPYPIGTDPVAQGDNVIQQLAEDVETVMDSIGLWLVKTQTVGTAVPSVTVTDCFNANYNAYKIIWTGGTLSAGADMSIYFGSTPPANGYYMSQLFYRYDTGASGVNTVNNQSTWVYSGGGDANGAYVNIEVFNPFQSVRKYFSYNGMTAVPFSVTGNGYFASTASFTSITLDPGGATTMTGGKICVYGYRQ